MTNGQGPHVSPAEGAGRDVSYKEKRPPRSHGFEARSFAALRMTKRRRASRQPGRKRRAGRELQGETRAGRSVDFFV